jgi:hypothetical protein
VAEGGVDVAIPELLAEPEAGGQLEDDLQVGTGLAARRYQGVAQLDESLRLLAHPEADHEGLGLERAGHWKHEVGLLGSRTHEEIGMDEEVQCGQRVPYPGAVAVGHGQVGSEVEQAVDAVRRPVQRSLGQVLARDELEPGGAQGPVADPEGFRALRVREQVGAVDLVGRDAREQDVPAGGVEAAGQSVELIDRADGLGGVAVLFQAAPGVERHGAGPPQGACGGLDLGGGDARDVFGHVG